MQYAQPRTLADAIFPRIDSSNRALVLARDAALILGGALLVALFAQIQIRLPWTTVPITGQTFAVLLVGASLGSIRGAASLMLYLAIGAVGAPVYSEQKGGWEVFSGATGGYIVGFVVAAALVGFLAERGWDRRFATSVSAMLTGSVVIYAFGLVWLQHFLEVSWTTALDFGLYPFVPGDIFKLYLAALALPGAWKLVERVKRNR
jgi:biotin transport system substrate-specific component